MKTWYHDYQTNLQSVHKGLEEKYEIGPGVTKMVLQHNFSTSTYTHTSGSCNVESVPHVGLTILHKAKTSYLGRPRLVVYMCAIRFSDARAQVLTSS